MPTVLKRPRVLVLAGIVIVLAVVLIAACGGDDEAVDAGAEGADPVEIVDPVEDLEPEPSPPPDPLEPEPAPVEPAAEPAELPITKVKGKPLKRGMENKRTLQLQASLIYLGYLEEGSADGKYGAKTKKAVQEFQLEQGLNGDGVAGPKTIRAINRAVKAAPAGGVSSSTSETATDDTSDEGSG